MTSDILIIGGGVAGLTAAAELSAHASVTLLEAEPQLAYHASGRSAAMFLEGYGNDTVRALNTASADHHLHADGGVLTPRAMMLLGPPDSEEAFIREAAAFGLTRIPTEEARARFPILDPVASPFAALREDAHDIDTDLLVQNARRRALANGTTIRTGQKVQAISGPGPWRVTTGDAEYTATTLVNAAGAWADEIAARAGLPRIGLTPLRRSMARIPLPDGLDPATWPFVDVVGEAWYAKPDAGMLIVSPGEEDPSDPMDAWADDMVIAEGLARFEAQVTMAVTRVQSTWAGLRTFAPDRTLVIGRDPVCADFVWLAGQGGYGFQTAPAAAALTRALVNGTPSDLPAPVVAALSPGRFR
ncbi:glycerol-3-phosphate dehydrogenase [Primorskyibacter flagellatus]|uniref:Glycerol-3-phosphate dehydrogenase n=1 Tax=Primorskyibacter flagellatus TaxID=1387277 RepID=A0A917AC45_9RHOB|nr:FAD-dependent oxidoreductase [Primorskyibacter flagellatus]GGE40084.1 glycerol-3-phosphate dehydrogenase [Primorskyibacter flagellatus]